MEKMSTYASPVSEIIEAELEELMIVESGIDVTDPWDGNNGEEEWSNG